jgi:S1-C subfamily serine protease
VVIYEPEFRRTARRNRDHGGHAGVGLYIQGSAADAAGIRVGDRVLKVNGMAVSDASSYITARNLETDLMHVVLRRNGKLLKFTLHFESFTRRYAKPDLTLN